MAPEPVAALLTALVPVIPPIPAVEAIPKPTPIPGLPTFASAVPRGEGDGCRSFWGPTPRPSFSEVRDGLRDICGAGDADLRDIMGTGSEVILAAEEIEDGTGGGVGRVATEVAGSLEVEATGVAASEDGAALDVSLLGDEVGDSVSTEEGLLNSTGLTLGVA